jgi:GxxExxY protein
MDLLSVNSESDRMENIKSFAKHVFKILGAGFSERVYHNAMEVLLKKDNICFLSEHTIPVMFEGVKIGDVRSDLVIEEKLVVELKVVGSVNDKHMTQCNMYMKLLKIQNGIVINFPQSDDEEVDFVEISLNNCSRCGRDSHNASTCYAKTHINGNRL